LRLDRLGRPGVVRMVASMLATEPSPDFIDFLFLESEGNPFFVAEYLRTAVQEGLLTRDDRGRWNLSDLAGERRDYSETLDVPAALQNLVIRRVSLLSDPA